MAWTWHQVGTRFTDILCSVPEYHLLWKPKNHFAVHIPTDILNFGPPRGYWCMRFEAKNQELKRSAKNSNFADVALAVARYWLHRSDRILRQMSNTRDCTTYSMPSASMHTATLRLHSNRLEVKQILDMLGGAVPAGLHLKLTYYSKVWHAGMLLSEHAWVAVTVSKVASLIMEVTLLMSLSTSGDAEETIFFVHGRAYDLHQRQQGHRFLLEDECRVPYARKSDVEDPRFFSMETISLHQCSITLLAAFVSQGVYRFVELP
eukprot:CAMPEP_0182801520 /NCGR_PEP_ID=MMETSP0006_2-20121128/2999_1 /TAXON_ID=97485 /ORGANISM="Prymnesium parvum, Strain Texoma1" /LENGTH=261 /DNA_ID=CAMNT_0024926853 /DNA_START=803 /DNA_END=1588 /DNA_ORIENTATION=-